jgi:hypothetical protein
MYMKLKKKLNSANTSWDIALQHSLKSRKRCVCGELLRECEDAYSHTTQGY